MFEQVAEMKPDIGKRLRALITLQAGIGGWGSESLGYFIDPVFATLEVKDINPEVYAERMAIHEEKLIKDCKWRLKDVRKNPTQAFNAYAIERLEFCGYDTSKLKREEK